MKKNNVMRVFSLLLALTLISVCAISGTFAKYVTKVEGQDHARVAKWGVLLNIEGNAFSDKYAATDASYLAAGGTTSVQAEEEGDFVVAPGTNSEQVGKTLKASVTGRPEVAARYAVVISDVEDIVLPAGTYTDYTVAPYNTTFTLDKDYAPVKWNLTIDKNGANAINVADALYAGLAQYPQYLAAAENYGLTPSGCSIFDAVKILKKVAPSDTYKQIVENALKNIVSGGRNFQLDVAADGTLTMSYDFDPLKEMGFNFELTWEWAFEGNDKADTYLGNFIAGELVDNNVQQPTAGEVSVNINATLTATATQID